MHAGIGSRYADRRFACQITALAGMVLQNFDGLDFNTILPGLGIPSDIAIVADPVSVGLSARVRHDSLLVMCLSIVSSRTGKLRSPMHSALAMPMGGHRGQSLCTQMFEALLQHPANWDMAQLKSRVASIGGDGALTGGGSAHRHRSSAAAEKFWHQLHPASEDVDIVDCVFWDAFHRADIAGGCLLARFHDQVTLNFISRATDPSTQ